MASTDLYNFMMMVTYLNSNVEIPPQIHLLPEGLLRLLRLDELVPHLLRQRVPLGA